MRNGSKVNRPEVQEALREGAKVAGEWYLRSLEEGTDAALAKMTAEGATITVAPEDMRKAWAAGMKNIAKEWAKRANASGLPGSEVLTLYMDRNAQRRRKAASRLGQGMTGMTGSLNRASHALDVMIDSLNIVGSLLIGGLVLLVSADVASRNIANSPLIGVPEVVALSIVGIVFLQLPYAMREHRLTRSDALPNMLVRRNPEPAPLDGGDIQSAGAGSGCSYPPIYLAAGRKGHHRQPLHRSDRHIHRAAMAGADRCHRILFRDADAARTTDLETDRRRTMTPFDIGLMCIAVMVVLVLAGLYVPIALIATSFCGVWAIKGSPVLAGKMLGMAVNDSIASYYFGIIPLFVLMGFLVAESDLGQDAYDVANAVLGRLTGGLAMGTVGANAIFAAITGISIASAAVFTKVAVPEMVRHGYTRRFAAGVVAGSSVLGMLIPPSLLLILYAVLTEQSVGDLFLAGIVPGLLLAAIFCLLIVAMTTFSPGFTGKT